MIDDTLAYKHSIVKVVVFVGHSSALSGHYERNSRLTKKKKKHSNKIAKFYSCHLIFFFERKELSNFLILSNFDQITILFFNFAHLFMSFYYYYLLIVKLK